MPIDSGLFHIVFRLQRINSFKAYSKIDKKILRKLRKTEGGKRAAKERRRKNHNTLSANTKNKSIDSRTSLESLQS